METSVYPVRVISGANAFVEFRKTGTNSVAASLQFRSSNYSDDDAVRIRETVSHIRDAIEQFHLEEGATGGKIDVILPNRYIKSFAHHDLMPKEGHLKSAEDAGVSMRQFCIIEWHNLQTEIPKRDEEGNVETKQPTRKGKRTKASQVRDLLRARTEEIRKGEDDKIIEEIMEIGGFPRGLAKQYFKNLSKELGLR